MENDQDRSMDVILVIMDQDQTRILLWTMIMCIFQGIIGIYSAVKKLFCLAFLPVFSSQYNSISGEICKLFLCRIGLGESSGHCVRLRLGRAGWGLSCLSGEWRGVT